jgi:hypothetical protein
MIEGHWRRISGVHVQDDGTIGVAWMAHDKDADCIHLYDACVFRREVIAVIAEGLNARGRWIPVAWEKAAKGMADKLLDRGCNMLPEPSDDADALAEVTSRDIWERMRSGRFKVDKRLAEWLDEFKTFTREDSKVPKTNHPLMAATRHAVAQLDYAKRQAPKGQRKTLYPKVAIV